jgi:WD40 repeat protein
VPQRTPGPAPRCTLRPWHFSCHDGHTSFIRSIDFSADGKNVLTHSNDKIRVWHGEDPPITIGAPKEQPFTGYARFAPDGDSIVTWPSEISLGERAPSPQRGTVRGKLLPPPSEDLLRALKQETDAIGTSNARYCSAAQWQRRGTQGGFVIASPSGRYHFWIPGSVSDVTIAGCNPRTCWATAKTSPNQASGKPQVQGGTR